MTLNSMEVTWTDYKDTCLALPHSIIRMHTADGIQHCYISEGPIELFCKIIDSADLAEFITLFSSRCNAPIVQKSSILQDAEGLSFTPVSTRWAINQGVPEPLSVALTQELYIMGGTLIIQDALPGDSISVEVWHPTAGPKGTPLCVGTYLKNYLVTPGTSTIVVREAAKLLPAGLILRATYNSVVPESHASWGINYTTYLRKN